MKGIILTHKPTGLKAVIKNKVATIEINVNEHALREVPIPAFLFKEEDWEKQELSFDNAEYGASARMAVESNSEIFKNNKKIIFYC